MSKKKNRTARVSGRLHEDLHAKFLKFCSTKKWTQSVAVEEAVIQMISK